MSSGGVDGNEMDGPHDFDDAATDALISGTGANIDRRVAETLGEMRAAYVSTPPPVGATLAALIGAAPPVAPRPLAPRAVRRFERARSSVLAKVGAAAAAVVAATGGLAVAGALPAPVQDAVSHLGVGSPAHGSADKDVKHGDANGDDRTPTSHGKSRSTTTVPGSATSTTTHKDNHGGEVSGVAHDPTLEGCAHGQAVAAVASDGKSQGKSCPTTTTTVAPGNGQTGATTTTTTVDHGGNGQGNGSPNGKGNTGGAHGQGKGH
jgi:hypothetical protein